MLKLLIVIGRALALALALIEVFRAEIESLMR